MNNSWLNTNKLTLYKAIKMEITAKKAITVETTIIGSIEKIWKYWNDPAHITKWYNASDDWHAPFAENDPRVGGKFKTTMAAKDGTMSFDFEGVYIEVINHELIKYTLADDRKVSISFKDHGGSILLTETFEPESTNTLELQRGGWQAIVDNFKKYTESH